MTGPEPDPDTDTEVIQTADQFARETEREQRLRWREAQDQHGLALARVWAPIVAVVVLGLCALIAFLVFQVTSEHARVSVEHEKQTGDKVTVWCYADPNSDRGTSTFTGSRQNVIGVCPDSRALP